MGNTLGVPLEATSIRVDGNFHTQDLLVNQGGQVTYSASNGDPSPRENVQGYLGADKTGVIGNVKAQHVLVQNGGNVTYTPRSTSPITSLKSVGAPCVFFKGRTKILSQINTSLNGPEGLTHKERFHERILVIYGIPGIGKSELMRRFAQVYTSEYPNIGWINAESRATIGKSFEAIADMLKVEWNDKLELKYNVRKVYQHVAKHCGPNCLFIFDNVADKKSEIHGYLPADQSIRSPPLIVMTANEPIRPFKSLQLEELTLEEALGVYRASRFLNLGDERFSEVEKPLTELATLIGCHPLGIVISGSYFCDKGTENLKEALDHYIKRFRELSEEFTATEPQVPARNPYKKNLQVLWQLTKERIQNGTHPNAMLSILRLLSYVDPEDVTKAELESLCLMPCPLEDGKYWTAFHENGSRLFDAAFLQLVKLSILIPVQTTETARRYPHSFRIHRVIQRFARLQDEEHSGFIRALYSSVDHKETLIYPGCLEYLNAIVEKRVTVDEKLKQICAAFALKASRNEIEIASFIEYLKKDEEKSQETACLLVLVQLYKNYTRKKHDPAFAMESIWSVVGIAKDWIGPEYGRYLIQHCATFLFILMLFEGCKDLTLISVPKKDPFDDMHDWMNGLLDLHNEQDWNFFPKMIDDCMFKAYRVLEKVTHPREGLHSMEDFLNCLVHRAYEYCRHDDELLDGYWHTMAVCFRIQGCRRHLIDEKMEFVVNHVGDTIRRCTRNNESVIFAYDGFRDFMAVIRNLPDCVSAFLSCNSFLEGCSGHTKILILQGFSEEHLSWLLVLGVALLHDQRTFLPALFSCWGLSELRLIGPYIEQAVAFAKTQLPIYGSLISGHSKELHSVLQHLERLESEAGSEGGSEGIVIATIVQTVSPILRQLLQSSND